jgi:hypothetical protein
MSNYTENWAGPGKIHYISLTSGSRLRYLKTGTGRALGHDDAMSVQGHRALLQSQGRRTDTRRCDLELRGSLRRAPRS